MQRESPKTKHRLSPQRETPGEIYTPGKMRDLVRQEGSAKDEVSKGQQDQPHPGLAGWRPTEALWGALGVCGSAQARPLPTPRKLLPGKARARTKRHEHGVGELKTRKEPPARRLSASCPRHPAHHSHPGQAPASTHKLGPVPHLAPLGSTWGK